MVCREDLSQFRNLQRLYLNLNDLKALPDDLFEDMPKLNLISFYGNKIESVTSKLFKPIIGNEFLRIDFRNNTKINAIFKMFHPQSPETIDEFLKAVDLQGC
jgi:predicted transcriptional regulator